MIKRQYSICTVSVIIKNNRSIYCQRFANVFADVADVVAGVVAVAAGVVADAADVAADVAARAAPGVTRV